MGERVARRIREAAGRAVDHLGDHRERLHGACADPRDEQKLGEILRTRLGRGGEGFVLDEETNVARPCKCRAQRIAHSRSRRLRREIPERYRDVAFDRNPVPDILGSMPSPASSLASIARQKCRHILSLPQARLI